VARKARVGQNGRQGNYQGCEEDERRDGARCRLDWPPRCVETDGRRGNSDDERGEPPRPDDARLQARRYRRLIDAVEFQDSLQLQEKAAARSQKVTEGSYRTLGSL
jgi:hypothetical protein